jgi:DNA-binding transcriptional LysR family regulator
VKLKLITGNSARLTDALERLEIDFAIIAETPASELFLSRKIREDRLVCLLAHSHPIARRKSLRFAELIEGPLIIREKGSVTRALLEAEIGRRGSPHARLIEIEGREAANEAVAQGLGLGIISRGELSRDPRLHVVPISDWQQTMSEWLVCLKARSDLHIMKAFLDLLNSSSFRRKPESSFGCFNNELDHRVKPGDDDGGAPSVRHGRAKTRPSRFRTCLAARVGGCRK